jgi:hypothetical protein
MVTFTSHRFFPADPGALRQIRTAPAALPKLHSLFGILINGVDLAKKLRWK